VALAQVLKHADSSYRSNSWWRAQERRARLTRYAIGIIALVLIMAWSLGDLTGLRSFTDEEEIEGSVGSPYFRDQWSGVLQIGVSNTQAQVEVVTRRFQRANESAWRGPFQPGDDDDGETPPAAPNSIVIIPLPTITGADPAFYKEVRRLLARDGMLDNSRNLIIATHATEPCSNMTQPLRPDARELSEELVAKVAVLLHQHYLRHRQLPTELRAVELSNEPAGEMRTDDWLRVSFASEPDFAALVRDAAWPTRFEYAVTDGAKGAFSLALGYQGAGGVAAKASIDMPAVRRRMVHSWTRRFTEDRLRLVVPERLDKTLGLNDKADGDGDGGGGGGGGGGGAVEGAKMCMLDLSPANLAALRDEDGDEELSPDAADAGMRHPESDSFDEMLMFWKQVYDEVLASLREPVPGDDTPEWGGGGSAGASLDLLRGVGRLALTLLLHEVKQNNMISEASRALDRARNELLLAFLTHPPEGERFSFSNTSRVVVFAEATRVNDLERALVHGLSYEAGPIVDPRVVVWRVDYAAVKVGRAQLEVVRAAVARRVQANKASRGS
jgi:hypothetical protein